MKLHTLQLFLRSLVEPLAQCHTPSEGIEDLRRTCDSLASFGELSLAQFNDLVRQARENQTTRQLLIPPHLQPVLACYESLRALKGRATSDGASREDVVRELEGVPLNGLDKTAIVPLAQDLGCHLDAKASKADAIDAIWRWITGESKPKKAPARASKPKAPFNVQEYAQRVNDLKEQANSPEVSREEIERRLKELGLDKLSVPDLRTLARELACDVTSKATKKEAIEAIERSVLLIKENLIGLAT
jgi:hypothetical protein